jgi:hypothetical protein
MIEAGACDDAPKSPARVRTRKKLHEVATHGGLRWDSLPFSSVILCLLRAHFKKNSM